jgi:general secretion pathway protein C
LAFVIWAVVAASAVFWLLRLWTSSPSAPAHTVAVAPSVAPRGDLSRVFGAPAPIQSAAPAPVEPALASRFKLLGVAAPKQGGDTAGLALIVVDDKPARGFKVGAVIDGDLVLQSVNPRGAELGLEGQAPAVTLELPPLPVAVSSARPESVPTAPAPMVVRAPVAVPTPIVPPPPGVPVPLPPQGGRTLEAQPPGAVPGRPGALTR